MPTIGIESEFPVVDRDGRAASALQLDGLFRHLLATAGFTPYHDAHTRHLVGVRRDTARGRLDVGTDYGVCTLEVAFPPEPDATQAAAAWSGFLDGVLLPALRAQGLSILAYGCQPLSRATGREWVASKGHYELMTRLIERGARFPADAWPSLAALQFNIDVPVEVIVVAANALVKLSPLICAWSANSPVFGSCAQPWLEMRAQAYIEMSTNAIFAGRFYFPPRLFRSLSDYIAQAWSLPIIEVWREGQVYRPADESLTTLAFAAAPASRFVDLRGEEASLTCTTADLSTGLTMTWPAMRIKLAFDPGAGVAAIVDAVAHDRAEDVLADGGRGTFVEVRHLPTMGREESLEWLRMMVAWLADPPACEHMVAAWRYEEVRACFAEVLAGGWDAAIAGRSLRSWGKEALDLAQSAGGGAWPGVERLVERLETATSPATEVLARFHRDGIGAVLADVAMA